MLAPVQSPTAAGHVLAGKRGVGSGQRAGWPDLAASVAACKASPLCQQRKQAVLGVGDVNADWLFVGEGPGAEEDAGRALRRPGRQAARQHAGRHRLARGDNVYIANAVKCRPPDNRTPEAAEIGGLPALSGAADRLAKAEAHRRARPGGGTPFGAPTTDRWPRCAAAVHEYNGIPRWSPITRPTCCAIFPRRPRPGKIFVPACHVREGITGGWRSAGVPWIYGGRCLPDGGRRRADADSRWRAAPRTSGR